MASLLSKLDPWLFRYPFEGRSAARYASRERCGFGDLDLRLIETWRTVLGEAATFLDVGAGPGNLARALKLKHPQLRVITIEPSAAFTSHRNPADRALRGRAEALPLANGSIDVACCMSSIRHVQNRGRAFRELRRVVRPGGTLFVVELDPGSSRRRLTNHSRSMRSLASRLMFAPLVARTAPAASYFEQLAIQSGWSEVTLRADPEQPVYVLTIT